MNVNDYQDWVVSKMDHSLNDRDALVKNGLGISGEAGEVTDLIKKNHFHGHKLDRQKLIEELGDVLWYITSTAQLIESDLNEIMHYNREKLDKRYPGGFSKEKSINREK